MILREISEHAGRAFQLIHNEARHARITTLQMNRVPPTKRRREITPVVELEPKSTLSLAFSLPPDDLGRGHVFGSDPKQSDILLAATKSSNGVSRIQFRITFNWKTGQPLLIDESTHGTVVGSKI